MEQNEIAKVIKSVDPLWKRQYGVRVVEEVGGSTSTQWFYTREEAQTEADRINRKAS